MSSTWGHFCSARFSVGILDFALAQQDASWVHGVSDHQGLTTQVPTETCPELPWLAGPLVHVATGACPAPEGAWHLVAVLFPEIPRMTEDVSSACTFSRRFRSFLAMRWAEEVPSSVDLRWGHLGTYGATSQESERVFCKGPHSKYFRTWAHMTSLIYICFFSTL